MTIRDAQPADAARIAAIYNLGIAERGATFETAERSPADVRDSIGDPGRPLVVAEGGDGAVAGFARVAPYSDRPVYRGIGEYSVYLDRDARGAGRGRALLEALLVRAEATGHWKLTSRLFPRTRRAGRSPRPALPRGRRPQAPRPPRRGVARRDRGRAAAGDAATPAPEG